MEKFFTLLILSLMISNSAIGQEDPYQWLEEVDGEKALQFVNKQNTQSFDLLSKQANYQSTYDNALKLYNASDRIAYPSIIGNHVYDFWQDAKNARGVWRRMLKDDYINGSNDWEVMLDIDALSAKDNIKWVYKGAGPLDRDFTKFLVFLSNGGGDATFIKEYDTNKKAFVEDGFALQESKGSASYLNANVLIVSRDFGPGTMTTSGYPRQVKLWKRGSNINEADLIFEGKETDVSAGGYVMKDGEKEYIFLYRSMTFYSSQSYVYDNGQLIPIEIPNDADINALLNGKLIITIKSDWEVNGQKYAQGSLLSIDFTDLLKGVKKISTIYAPNETSSIAGVSNTKNHLVMTIIDHVSSELYVYQLKGDQWIGKQVNTPAFGTISPMSFDDASDDYFFDFQNFLTPPSLFYGNTAQVSCKSIKSRQAYFDASQYEVKQYETKSKDGTMIPYFVVASKNIQYNGSNPTLLYGYGGFEVSMKPSYSGIVGQAWLDKGGVYVLANIRGGGEYGPKWHQAGLKEKRQNVYNDFHAIAEDLISKRITSPKHLGIMGGSNGGLLVGVAFTQRPDLYNAVICAVPLLDMKRYNHLLAGASWMGEYGDPDKEEEWQFIQKYSPYHNLKADVKYPEVFFTTSTRDDRVHPGHARKMVAKMTDMGYKVYYYENTEGGHAGSSTNDQRAKSAALQYSYLLMKLK